VSLRQPLENRSNVERHAVGLEPPGLVARRAAVSSGIESVDGDAVESETLHERRLPARAEVEVGKDAPRASVQEEHDLLGRVRDARPHGERVAVGHDLEPLELGRLDLRRRGWLCRYAGREREREAGNEPPRRRCT